MLVTDKRGLPATGEVRTSGDWRDLGESSEGFVSFGKQSLSVAVFLCLLGSITHAELGAQVVVVGDLATSTPDVLCIAMYRPVTAADPLNLPYPLTAPLRALSSHNPLEQGVHSASSLQGTVQSLPIHLLLLPEADGPD